MTDFLPDGLSQLDQMVAHIESAPIEFQPTAFWRVFLQRNIDQITSFGIANFKRTINQNYFNWLPNVDDNQFRSILKLTADFPSVEAFCATIDEDFSAQSFFQEDPLGDTVTREAYRLFVGMLWQYSKLSYPNGLLDAIDEPELGNPLPVRLDGRLISQDLANSVRERNVIAWPWEEDFANSRSVSFVEIGAGYGRLAYVFLKSAPVRYTIVDIPPALFVSQWYLSNLFPDRKIFKFSSWSDYAKIAPDLASAEISFLTPDQFALLPDGYFDAGITISSLAEMTHHQVKMYLELLDRKTRKQVYIKQWIESKNELDDEFFVRSDFDMPDNWTKQVDRIDAVQDKFFETLWQKVI